LICSIICPNSTFSTINSTTSGLGSKPGIYGERPATNRLSHGTFHQGTKYACVRQIVLCGPRPHL
jgi:hypothetical protein